MVLHDASQGPLSLFKHDPDTFDLADSSFSTFFPRLFPTGLVTNGPKDFLKD